MSEYRQQMTKSKRDWADGLAQIIQSSVDYPISGDYDDEFKALAEEFGAAAGSDIFFE